MDKTLCQVYRSPKKEGMYLYVLREDNLSKVPEELLARFGTPELAMSLVVTPDKQLARMSGTALLEALNSKGFYLQLPMASSDEMREIRERNSKL